jgi:hypothetical protein
MAEDAGVFTPRTDQRPECLPVHGRSARPIDGYFSRSRLVLREVDHQTDHQTEGLQRPDPDAVGRDTPLDLREWTNSDSARRARWDWKACGRSLPRSIFAGVIRKHSFWAGCSATVSGRSHKLQLEQGLRCPYTSGLLCLTQRSEGCPTRGGRHRWVRSAGLAPETLSGNQPMTGSGDGLWPARNTPPEPSDAMFPATRHRRLTAVRSSTRVRCGPSSVPTIRSPGVSGGRSRERWIRCYCD